MVDIDYKIWHSYHIGVIREKEFSLLIKFTSQNIYFKHMLGTHKITHKTPEGQIRQSISWSCSIKYIVRKK